MKPVHRYAVWIAAGLIILAGLIRATVVAPPSPDALLPIIWFSLLIVFTTTYGVWLSGGSVSLLPMATVAAYLVTGPLPVAWAAFAGAVLHGAIRFLWSEQLGLPAVVKPLGLIGLTAANVTVHVSSILVGGAAFRALGGTTPLARVVPADILPLLALGLVYVAVNHAIASLYIGMRGRAPFHAYLRSLPGTVVYEAAPLLAAPLAALIYVRLGLSSFVLFSLLLVAGSLITRSLAFTSRRLERRIKELDGLQAVGQALSASLDVNTVVEAIYDQVARLMPADNFYIALYDPEVEEVWFPLATEGGQRVEWRSRRTGTGLTEHVLRALEPLLIRGDLASALAELGIEAIGRSAACWLGVPILAGNEPLGVIAVQSFDAPGVYDASHEEILVTIAAQAAVAIQNARLYARTDEALARRVQELGSILRAAGEGILLLDAHWRVLAANRALAEFLGVAQSELSGQALGDQMTGATASLAQMIGYELEQLLADCDALVSGKRDSLPAVVVLGVPERHLERTLTPVRDETGQVAGWLFVFRDITEEIELARLRDDMTHMLVHDLRSPLTVLLGSLDLMEIAVAEGRADDFENSLGMARRNNDRILNMVSELLDISKLESGRVLVHPSPVEPRSVLEEAVNRLTPLAAEAKIALEVEVEPELPPLNVDPDLIGRVVVNLLDNAIKFTPDEGRIRLWARLDPQRASEGMLLGVTDDGPGIDPATQALLFKKFQQPEGVRGRRAGTGLGLPFCKLAVEAHGGRVWVESELGRGTTFVVSLPTAP